MADEILTTSTLAAAQRLLRRAATGMGSKSVTASWTVVSGRTWNNATGKHAETTSSVDVVMFEASSGVEEAKAPKAQGEARGRPQPHSYWVGGADQFTFAPKRDMRFTVAGQEYRVLSAVLDQVGANYYITSTRLTTDEPA